MLERMLPRNTVALLLLLLSAPAMAESVYVIDVLRVGVRATPTGSGPSQAVVKSGDRLEVLEKQGGYYRVRAAGGTEGWINKGYLSEGPTAAQRLASVEKDNELLRREIDTLKAARGKEGEAIDALQQQLGEKGDELATTRQQRDALQEQVDALTSSKEGVFARFRWLFELAAALLLLGVGLYFGRCSYRCRIRRRFGGMEI